MFWNNFVSLCAQKGVSPSRAATELGFSTGTVAWWKKGRHPRDTALIKIADYFGVTVADLLSEDLAAPASSPAPSVPSNEELAAQIAELRSAMSAGARSAEPTLSPARREAVEIIKELDDSQLDDVIKYIKFLESQNK